MSRGGGENRTNTGLSEDQREIRLTGAVAAVPHDPRIDRKSCPAMRGELYDGEWHVERKGGRRIQKVETGKGAGLLGEPLQPKAWHSDRIPIVISVWRR